MSPTLRLTCAESGHIISDNPERVRASSSHILHCEVAFLPPFAAYGRWPKSGPVRQWRHKRNELRHKAQRRAATNRPRQKPKPGRRPQFCQPITVTQELPEDRDEVTRLLNGALKPFRGDPLGSKPREYLARICCLLAASVRYPQTQPMHAGCHSEVRCVRHFTPVCTYPLSSFLWLLSGYVVQKRLSRTTEYHRNPKAEDFKQRLC